MTKRGITKDEFRKWARDNGWHDDKWGHMQKTVDNEVRRYKIQAYTVRREVKSDWGWIHIGTLQLSKLQIADGKLGKIKDEKAT